MKDKLCFYTPAPFPRIKSYFDMIDVAVEFGLTRVEGFCSFEFEKPDTEAAKRIREYADSKNIKFPCFSLFANVIGENIEEKLERIRGYVDVAKILGSPYIHHTIVCECLNPDNVIPYKEAFFEEGIASVRKIYDYAESMGVRAIYEEQGYIFNGIKGFERFLDAVDREIGVVADFGNIYQSGDNITDFVKKFAHSVTHAHIKDVYIDENNENSWGYKTLTGKYMKETDPGKGIVDFKSVINILKEAGYNGYYGLEFGATSDDSPMVSEAIDYISSFM